MDGRQNSKSDSQKNSTMAAAKFDALERRCQSEPWHAVNAQDAMDGSFFYVKCVCATHAETGKGELAFVLLITDLLGVWRHEIRHDNAAGWVKEQHSTLVENYLVLLEKARKVIVGENTAKTPVIRIADLRELELSPLTMEAPLSERVTFKFKCAQLDRFEAGVVVREQLLLPLTQICGLFWAHSPAREWECEQTKSAAEEHTESRASCLEFTGSIGHAYRAFMERRFLRVATAADSPAAPDVAMPSARARPAGGEASGVGESGPVGSSAAADQPNGSQKRSADALPGLVIGSTTQQKKRSMLPR
jgi:hypothetical protein